MRAFIALELPESFIADVVELSRQLSACANGRFMRRDTYHLTLAFLGDVDETSLSEVFDAMDASCAGREPVPLRCDGLGTFGRKSDATLWLGIVRTPFLENLATSLREELMQRDIAFDSKAFKPHITLARRVRLPRGTMPQLAFPRENEASAVTAFKSTLTSEGAFYKPLYTVHLEKR